MISRRKGNWLQFGASMTMFAGLSALMLSSMGLIVTAGISFLMGSALLWGLPFAPFICLGAALVAGLSIAALVFSELFDGGFNIAKLGSFGKDSVGRGVGFTLLGVFEKLSVLVFSLCTALGVAALVAGYILFTSYTLPAVGLALLIIGFAVSAIAVVAVVASVGLKIGTACSYDKFCVLKDGDDIFKLPEKYSQSSTTYSIIPDDSKSAYQP